MSETKLKTQQQDLKIFSKEQIVPTLRATASDTHPEVLVESRNLLEFASECLEGYLAEAGLDSCTVKCKCSSSDFDDLIKRHLDREIPSAKFEYIDGFVEVTVFASRLHHAITNINYTAWLQYLPGISNKAQGFPFCTGSNVVIQQCCNERAIYQQSATDNRTLVMEPHVSLSCLFSSTPDRGSVIFEACYSQSLKRARDRAKKYLLRSDNPQPKVVVIFNIESQQQNSFVGVNVGFEVYRRDESNVRKTKLCQQGMVYPRHLADRDGNAKEIFFDLEELIGDKQFIEDALALDTQMRKERVTKQSLMQEIKASATRKAGMEPGPDMDTESSHQILLIRKKQILGLGDELLEVVRQELSQNRKTWLPISMITEVIEDKMAAQLDEQKRSKKAKDKFDENNNDVHGEIERKARDTGDENYEPPSEGEETDSGASNAQKTDEVARGGGLDEKELNDSGSPDELA